MPTLYKTLSDQIIDGHTSISDLLNILLVNRHILPELQANFINPPFPEFFINYSIAIKLINDTIKRNKHILIYGDYDVDGISATAILWQTIHKIYQKVTPFIPSRQVDGYGIKADSIFRLQQAKNTVFDLIITVDNGIVAGLEFSQIKARQDSRFIVIDHHVPDLPLTDIDALIHTTTLSGAALTWFFACQFDHGADLGLAALGTVADCMPLNGVNRSIVVHGLHSLRLNPSPGIKKLIEVSGIKPGTLTAYDLGFVLGPRINAIGRLSDPTDALRLLCSQNSLQASTYAHTLNTFNRDRQLLQSDSLDKADSYVDSRKKIIFISDSSFNPGIIGLIAGRLTEKYYRPSIIISTDGIIARGSCRSIPEINIIDTLRKFSKLFIDLGGHSAAAGFSILPDNIVLLKKAITTEINKQLKGKILLRQIIADVEMKLSAVKTENIKAIDSLSPFGIGNQQPLFVFKQLKIVSKKLLGANLDHLKLKLDDPNTPRVEYLSTDAIAFKKGELDKVLQVGDLVDVIASVNLNIWNGRSTPQLMVKEIIQNN